MTRPTVVPVPIEDLGAVLAHAAEHGAHPAVLGAIARLTELHAAAVAAQDAHDLAVGNSSMCARLAKLAEEAGR